MSCYLCGKKSIGRYSPDLDIRGVGFCKKHKDEVFMRLLILMEEMENKPKKKSKTIKR